ncbi:hypothetical protein EVV80_28645, partial [Klebsiella pneumoniae]
HAAQALEMGADAVLVNTAIAVADDPSATGPRLPYGDRCRITGASGHAAQALEMGADAVLVNTAIAVADDPSATGPRL